jgi:Predicted chitinase
MNRSIFYDRVRGSLFNGRLTQSQVDGLEALLNAMEGWPVAYQAYGMATAFHETSQTMKPIMERGGYAYYTRLYDVTGQNPARARSMGNTTPGDGAKYCGRGYVQLTWKTNYERAGKDIGVDLVNFPELAMDPANAAKIMRDGMEQGWFTGKKLSDYLANGKKDYVGARRIINGTDKAQTIAGYAQKFETALRAAGAGK